MKSEVQTTPAVKKRMSAVRRKGTSVELVVREFLKTLDVSFKTNVKDKPGKPDIWVNDTEIPIFIHGCFWHRHEGCKKATTPKSNISFWEKKFQANVLRDIKVQQELRDLGYNPVTIWQCETESIQNLSKIIWERVGLCGFEDSEKACTSPVDGRV